MKKRIVSLLLTLVMVLSLVPMSVFAADNHDGQVHVIVENTTYPEAEGAPWEGTLVEEWIDLNEDSTMMGCVVEALEKNGYEQTGAENNYISSIEGLGEFDGGSMSGWMGTLNDWFTNYGFGAFTVAAGTLGSGDEIRIMYTRNGYGADLGGSWDNHIKTVKALTFSAGELSPAFHKDTHEYTLTVDKGTDSVLVTPTASNKNYQVRTYVGETEYKRTAMVPTVDGTTITVKCGDPSWPNMNHDNEPAQVYTVNVKVKSDDKPVTPANTKVLVRAQDGGAWLHQPMVRELTGGEAEKYGYTDKVEGVSALDALVVSHELTFGDDFTPETAKDFLEVSSSGFITKLYGTETYVCGFYVNAGYPNDGTKAPSGPGYNGTTVVNTKLNDGDTVDFFFYADGDAYSDYYTWIDVPETMVTGEAITVTVKGFYAMEGYRYKDAAELKAAARPLEGVGLAWVDADGYIKPIKGVVTDEDGQATFTVGSEATGYLVAQSGDGVYALMNPSDYIRKVAGKPVETLGLTIRSQADNAYLQSMDKELEVASNTAEKYGFTDKVEGVSVLDALVAAHELVYGDKFTPATAKQYLAIDSQTDWESKVFGRETGFHGFYINNDFPTNEAGAARPKVTDTKLLDGDVLDYFVGSDTENQNDYYTWLEVPATMTSGEDITVTVKGVKAMDPDATQANAQPLEGVGLAWVDMATGTQDIYYPKESPLGYVDNGKTGYETIDKYNHLLDFYLQYAKDFNEKHHFDIMAGYSWQHFHRSTENAYNNLNGDNPTSYIFKTESYLISFFGRVNYSFMNRYLITATLRNDGTSRFSKDNRWGLFPSVALGWKIKEEGFMKDVDAVSDLKLRLGYGITGQQDISQGDYPYMATYFAGQDGAYYQFGDQFVPIARPDGYNPNLKWEETTTWNAGFDFGFLDNRITSSLDYYYRETKDLINVIDVPAGTNFKNRIVSNIGSLRNQGVEFSINAKAISTSDWKWDLGFNVAWNNNEITKLTAQDDASSIVLAGTVEGGTGTMIQAQGVNHPANSFYVYEQVYDQQGNPIEGLYVDRNGDGVINDEDRYFCHKPAADVTMGFTSKLVWKAWDFSFSLRSNLGNYVYNNVASSNAALSEGSINNKGYLSNRPLSAFDTNFQNMNVLSDYYVQNASFLRCDNITLGYSFNKLFGVLGGRIYGTVQNPFVITKYKGLDPEVANAADKTFGIDKNVYPRPLVGILGVSLNF